MMLETLRWVSASAVPRRCCSRLRLTDLMSSHCTSLTSSRPDLGVGSTSTWSDRPRRAVVSGVTIGKGIDAPKGRVGRPPGRVGGPRVFLDTARQNRRARARLPTPSATEVGLGEIVIPGLLIRLVLGEFLRHQVGESLLSVSSMASAPGSPGRRGPPGTRLPTPGGGGRPRMRQVGGSTRRTTSRGEG